MGSNPNNLPDMRMRGGANMDMAAQSAVDFNSTSNDVDTLILIFLFQLLYVPVLKIHDHSQL